MSLRKNEELRLAKDVLTQSDIQYFRNQYGKRFVRALRAVEEKRVFKYEFNPSESSIWTVKGKRNEYFVIPETFCTCRDFYQAVVIAREVKMCYHLLATSIAIIRNSFVTIGSTDSVRRTLLAKWRYVK
ncbi:MAG: hypothetical protein GF411_06580 [Candidatus Lokiarchaeota archaeon]|nr:hypothetical protein [Candidatus Lokiarchaeota archaeon]